MAREARSWHGSHQSPRLRARWCAISEGTVRSSSSILLSLALLVAFVQAPFMHTHQHEATQKHAGAFLHFHLRLASAASGRPELRGLDPNDDALYAGWISASPTHSGSITPVVREEPFSLFIPERTGWTVETPLGIGHDPPLIRRNSPRAPPA